MSQLALKLRLLGEQSATQHLTKVAPSALAALVDQVQWMAQAGTPFTSEQCVAKLPAMVRECFGARPQRDRRCVLGDGSPREDQEDREVRPVEQRGVSGSLYR